jgi:hypothetical protein
MITTTSPSTHLLAALRDTILEKGTCYANYCYRMDLFPGGNIVVGLIRPPFRNIDCITLYHGLNRIATAWVPCPTT